MNRRWTINELMGGSTKNLIIGLLNERRSPLNPAAPLAVEIEKLVNWCRRNLPDTREHD